MNFVRSMLNAVGIVSIAGSWAADALAQTTELASNPPSRASSSNSIELTFVAPPDKPWFVTNSSDQKLCTIPCTLPVVPRAELRLRSSSGSDGGQAGYLRVTPESRLGARQIARIRYQRDWWYTGFGIGLGVLGAAGLTAAILAPSDDEGGNTAARVGVGIVSGVALLAGVIIVVSNPTYASVDLDARR